MNSIGHSIAPPWQSALYCTVLYCTVLSVRARFLGACLPDHRYLWCSPVPTVPYRTVPVGIPQYILVPVGIPQYILVHTPCMVPTERTKNGTERCTVLCALYCVHCTEQCSGRAGVGIEFAGPHNDLVVANPDRPQLAPKRFEFEQVRGFGPHKPHRTPPPQREPAHRSLHTGLGVFEWLH